MRKEETRKKETEAQSANLSQTIGVPKHTLGISTHIKLSEQNLKGSDSSLVGENKTKIAYSVQNRQDSEFCVKNHANKSKIAEEGYNLNYGGLLNKTEQKIVETIENSELPITPKQIATITKINHNSVKVYCASLKKRNFIVKVFRGEYTSRKKLLTSKGCIGGKVTLAPRVHNLRFKFSYVGERGIVKELDYDIAKVKAVIGSNGTANVYVSCTKEGLDLSAYRVLMACVRRELQVPNDSSVVVTGFELNIDYKGLKLEGVKAMTLTAFDGSFERLYQKHRDVLRSEVRAVGPTTPEAVYQLLKGGVGPYNIMQGLALVVNETRQEREAQKQTNRLLYELLTFLKERK